MPDRENVISALEEQITWIRDNDFHKFPGWGHAVLAMRDALALLKAQEPKLLTWQEVIGSVLECKPAYIEVRESEDKEPGDDRWVMLQQYKDNLANGMLMAKSSYIESEVMFEQDYGKVWRCWDKEPTDGQRLAVKWE